MKGSERFSQRKHFPLVGNSGNTNQRRLDFSRLYTGISKKGNIGNFNTNKLWNQKESRKKQHKDVNIETTVGGPRTIKIIPTKQTSEGSTFSLNSSSN
mmetsp:Transcript_1898/g.2003  ORF Transcript_1898/g.2003 Transcript_1898/m.2003 type:complete len:98 (-) Transcript_1898:688-981(-)